MPKNYYLILGITADACPEEIKAAFRRLHPEPISALELFEPAEIALVLGGSAKEVEGLLAGIRGRLGDALPEQSAV